MLPAELIKAIPKVPNTKPTVTYMDLGHSSADADLSVVEDRRVVLTGMLRHDRRDQQGRPTRLEDQLRKGVEAHDVLDHLYGLSYLSPRYSLTYAGQEIEQLSPGERGLLLLVFYLLVDKDDIPIVIDQPEENLDNQTIYRILVKCIKAAKGRRQVLMVTHNPNLAVVCDAEQIIYAHQTKPSLVSSTSRAASKIH
jgi:ATPase subunit of ABC transporter with duplicated ATPase domains